MRTEVLNVSGMTCGGCVAAITRSFESREGVRHVDVDLAAGKVTVEFDPSRGTVAALREAIEEAGFEVKSTPSPRPPGGCCCN